MGSFCIVAIDVPMYSVDYVHERYLLVTAAISVIAIVFLSDGAR